MAEAVGAVGSPGNKPAGRRSRKSSPARRAQLLDAAYEALVAGAPTDGGMADVADAAGVSVGLLYHYFPGGRAELVEALTRRLLDDLCDRVEIAANLPFSPMARLEHALAALVGFFVDRPIALPLLFPGEDNGASGSDSVSQVARVHLVSTLTALMADPAWSAEELFDAGSQLVDRTLADVGRCLAGAIEPEAAWRSSSRRARRLFRG
jgi:AcrR family transcriptional regulator